jgi:hypothetical protein
MMAYGKMSYWDVYHLPVPLRKWLIQRYNKHVEKQNSNNPGADPDKPLTESQRLGMIRKAQQANPLVSKEFMTSRRNRK